MQPNPPTSSESKSDAAPTSTAGDIADRDQLATLVREHEAALLAVAMRLCRSRDDAQDLVQDTFERALRNPQTIDSSARVRAWLCTILHNRFIDECRRRRRARASEPITPENEVPAPTPEPPPSWADVTSDDLRAAIAQLDDEFREAYVMYALHHRSYDDISRTLGIAKSTVGTRLMRARRKLRAILQGGMS